MEKYRKTCKPFYIFVQETYIKVHVCLYFLHLVLTFILHYIIMVKGPLSFGSLILRPASMNMELPP